MKSNAISESDFFQLWPVISDTGSKARYDRLLTSGVLEKTNMPVTGRAPVVIPADNRKSNNLIYMNAPTELELCLTRRCNQACIHCNVSAVSEKKKEKINGKFWNEILNQAVEERVLRVTLTGGEPFVRHGINEILESLSTKPLGAIILTNGTVISDEQIDIIRNSNGSITLSISLDGVSEAQHDKFRRSPGAFRKTIETMHRLAERGIKFVISSVIHAENVDEAENFFEIVKSVCAAKLVIVPMAAVGRAKSAYAQKYFPSSKTMIEAISKLKRIALNSKGVDVVIGSADPSFKEITKISDRYSGATAMSKRNPGFCKAGIYSMAVDEDGLAYSCLRGLQERIHPIGDLKTHRLRDVWQSQAWRDFRDPLIPSVPCRVEEIASRPAI